MMLLVLALRTLVSWPSRNAFPRERLSEGEALLASPDQEIAPQQTAHADGYR
jgi:hypothetical protein